MQKFLALFLALSAFAAEQKYIYGVVVDPNKPFFGRTIYFDKLRHTIDDRGNVYFVAQYDNGSGLPRAQWPYAIFDQRGRILVESGALLRTGIAETTTVREIDDVCATPSGNNVFGIRNERLPASFRSLIFTPNRIAAMSFTYVPVDGWDIWEMLNPGSATVDRGPFCNDQDVFYAAYFRSPTQICCGSQTGVFTATSRKIPNGAVSEDDLINKLQTRWYSVASNGRIAFLGGTDQGVFPSAGLRDGNLVAAPSLNATTNGGPTINASGLVAYASAYTDAVANPSGTTPNGYGLFHFNALNGTTKLSVKSGTLLGTRSLTTFHGPAMINDLGTTAFAASYVDTTTGGTGTGIYTHTTANGVSTVARGGMDVLGTYRLVTRNASTAGQIRMNKLGMVSFGFTARPVAGGPAAPLPILVVATPIN